MPSTKEVSRRYYLKNREKILAQNRAYSKKNRAKVRARQTAWRKANARRVKNKYLVQTHGITIEQYEVMWVEQCGRCKICERIPNRDLFVDHCHLTGRIRGLLCSECNFGVRHFQDDASLLAKAYDYLTDTDRWPGHIHPQVQKEAVVA